MGKVLSDLALRENNVVCGVCRSDYESKFPIVKDIYDFEGHADVVIDFSNHETVERVINYCVQNKMPVVICTTGLSNETEMLITKFSAAIPIFKAANTSLGVNVINLLLSQISKLLYDFNFDIEIVEKHHGKKIDSPSGTALLLAKTINSVLNNDLSYEFSRYEKTNARQKNELGIHSIRGGTIIGEHSVIFAGDGETIEIKHVAQSRDVFAIGALKAAEFIIKQSPGLYSMTDLIS